MPPLVKRLQCIRLRIFLQTFFCCVVLKLGLDFREHTQDGLSVSRLNTLQDGVGAAFFVNGERDKSRELKLCHLHKRQDRLVDALLACGRKRPTFRSSYVCAIAWWSWVRGFRPRAHPSCPEHWRARAQQGLESA